MRDSVDKITVRKICPACNGRGTSRGLGYCGCCGGSHKVTETVSIRREGGDTYDPEKAVLELLNGFLETVDESDIDGTYEELVVGLAEAIAYD